MKCCGSRATSVVPNPVANATRPREAAAQFAALLMTVAFKPLASAMGFYGDLVVGTAAQTIARAERGGLTDRLERAIDSAARPSPEVSK